MFEAFKKNMDLTAQGVANLTGGLCTAMAVGMSAVLIRQHLASFTNPKEQQKILYIIAMVPLFAVNSFVGMLEYEASETFIMVMDSVKECYEAWVILSFLTLMYSLVGVSLASKTIPIALSKKHIHQVPPMNYILCDWPVNVTTLKNLRMWCVQFCLLRPFLSVLSVVLQVYDLYTPVYIYISIVLNISVTLAVYALMMFYHTFEHELAPHRPLAKFLCIKGVVFFAFWQGVVVEFLVHVGVIHAGHWYTVEELATGIQNLLVCLEMGLIFTFAHMYAFPVDAYRKKKEKL